MKRKGAKRLRSYAREEEVRLVASISSAPFANQNLHHKDVARVRFGRQHLRRRAPDQAGLARWPEHLAVGGFNKEFLEGLAQRAAAEDRFARQEPQCFQTHRL
jgi:hypothetical protein